MAEIVWLLPQSKKDFCPVYKEGMLCAESLDLWFEQPASEKCCLLNRLFTPSQEPDMEPRIYTVVLVKREDSTNYTGNHCTFFLKNQILESHHLTHSLLMKKKERYTKDPKTKLKYDSKQKEMYIPLSFLSKYQEFYLKKIRSMWISWLCPASLYIFCSLTH